MYSNSELDPSVYAECMTSLKMLNKQYKIAADSCSQYHRSQLTLKKLGQKIWNKITDKRDLSYASYPDLPNAINDRAECNYFFDEKIAIYTCIIGKYDVLNEPLFVPDNCDFYAITDFEIPENSRWKRLPVENISLDIPDMTPTYINRYIKMHPHKIFSEYNYSIYMDGNFRAISDLTEHINRLGIYGFSTFRHHKRTCVYEELDVCKALMKEDPYLLALQEEFLLTEGMPKQYGLLACNFLVRNHSLPACQNIMELWWKSFCKYAKRDQLSLPLVLFKMGINISDIATLGRNVRSELSFFINNHK